MRPRFPSISLEGLLWHSAGCPPPAAAVAAVRAACLHHGGVWHASDHGIGGDVHSRLLAASRAFFDQPAARKSACAVGDGDRSRGWEMYPQHRRFHRARMAIAELPPHAEPSASEGILCERFVCGPPSICSASARTLPPHRFYDSEFGRVFYERNVWPKDDGGALQAAAETAYPGFERLAHGCMQVIAAALGLPHTAFDELVSAQSPAHLAAPLRHHSRLQINNYPSQLPARGVAYTTCPLRASRHFDTSLLTVLDREPRVDTEAVAGSSGALEVFLPSRGSAAGGIGDGADGEWTCVPARPGE